MEEGSFTLDLGRAGLIDVPPLELDQVRRICVQVDATTKGQFTEIGFAAQIEILLAGLAVARPDLDRAALGHLQIGRKKLDRAVMAILVAAEVIDPDKPKGGAPGEEAAASV